MAACRNLSAVLDDVTKCPICLEDFVQPKVLPCLHSFCLRCLQTYVKSIAIGWQWPRTFNCPICIKQCAVPDGGIERFLDNFPAKEMIQLKKSIQPRLPASPEDVPCEICSTDDTEAGGWQQPSSEYCSDCKQLLCVDCSKPHKKMPNGPHNVVPFNTGMLLSQFKGVEHDHGDMPVKWYCMDCSIAVCFVCRHRLHRQHNCRDIEDVAADCRKNIQSAANGVLAVINKLEQRLDAVREPKTSGTSSDDSVAAAMRTIKAIKKQANDMKRLIDKSMQQLLPKLEHYKTTTSNAQRELCRSIEAEMSDLKDFVGNCLECMTEKEPAVVTKSACALMTEAGELVRKNDGCFEHQENENFISDFIFAPTRDMDADNVIGNVQSVRLIRKLATGAPIFGIASFGSDLYVGRESSHWIDIYNSTSGIKKGNVGVRNLKSIYDMVTCSLNKCLYIADWKALKIFTVDLTEHHKQSNWSVNDVVDISGLSSDNVGNVLVTCKSAPPSVGQIKIFGSEGRLQREIRLQPELIGNPQHSIKLSGVQQDQYLVCHDGGLEQQLYQVSLVNDSGVVQRTLDRLNGRTASTAGSANNNNKKLNRPLRLALAIDETIVFIADSNNRRVVLTDRNLSSARRLELDDLTFPTRLWYDKTTKVLFVATVEWGNDKPTGGINAYQLSDLLTEV